MAEGEALCSPCYGKRRGRLVEARFCHGMPGHQVEVGQNSSLGDHRDTLNRILTTAPFFLFWTFRDSGRLKNPIFEQGNGKLRNGKLKKQLSEEFERQIDQSL